MRQNVIKGAIGFLIFMAAFTVISRAAFGVTASRVRTEHPHRAAITHSISSQGEVRGKQELAVRVPEGLVIKKVCVSQGDSLSRGKTLFVLEPEELNYSIEVLKQELASDLQAPGQQVNTLEQSTQENISVETIKKKQTLQILLQFQAKGGRVCAGGSGFVTEVNVKAGDRTTGGGDIRYTDASQGLFLTASFDEEQRKFLKKSGKVTVTGEQGTVLSDLKIKSIRPDEEQPGQYLVAVEVPGKHLKIGSRAEITVESREQIYETCIPRQALHQAEDGSYYLYTVGQEESITGLRQIATRTAVEVADKNESLAAVEGLEEGTEIITEADRELEDGSRIRRLEP